MVIAVLALMFAACDSWLDVKPKKLVEEEDLFSSENGFKEALTGIYLKLGKKELYGREMTYGFIDVLGQYWQPLDNGKSKFDDPLYYTFPSTATSEYTESIWRKMYNEIANINNLLAWLEKKREVLQTPGYYEIIKGEALGLRAFLHFDLLRTYGPVYSENKEAKSIVYRTEFEADSRELLPASRVIQRIVEDLQQAEKLLADDPLSFEFPKYSVQEEDMEGDPFLVYRYRRMNLYAVKALAARVHLYGENWTEAAGYAKEVIDSKLFKLVYDNTVDRVYSTELIFSLYIPRFADQIAGDFSPGRYYLIGKRSFLDEMFDTYIDGKNDIRYKAYKEDNNGIFSQKYEQSGMWVSTEGTIPLIRLSEMYYILAECAKTDKESYGWLNDVREARSIDDISYNTPGSRLLNIEKEYRKEFCGEGQLFFFYKRNYYRSFLHCPLQEMTQKNYVFSLPENEIVFGRTEE